MAVLLNGTPIEELSHIIHITKAQTFGKKLCAKLKDMIPRQMVQVAIQAVVNGKIVGRETIKAYRKDVTAKLVSGIYSKMRNYDHFVLVRRRCNKAKKIISSTGSR